MGMDASIILPDNVRLRNVSRACGILLGCHFKFEKLGPSSRVLEVPGVKIRGMSEGEEFMIGCASIDIRTGKPCPTCQNCTLGVGYSFLYHFENNIGPGRILSLNRSRAINIAVGFGLLNFFGGTLRVNDHTDQEFTLPAKSDQENGPNDGKEWDDFQVRLAAIKPISQDDIKLCEEYAAYKDRDS